MTALIIGPEIEQDERVKRFFQGLSKLRPPKPRNSSHDTGPQALNNSCSDYISKFQVLCLRIVSERVRDSTKAYRTIYKYSY